MRYCDSERVTDGVIAAHWGINHASIFQTEAYNFLMKIPPQLTSLPAAHMDGHIHELVAMLFWRDGVYSPIMLLVELGALRYNDYLDWRCGARASLDDALLCPRQHTLNALYQGATAAQNLGLRERIELRPGATGAEYTAFGTDVELMTLAYAVHERPTSSDGQLDLFLDAGVTPLLHTISDALLRHDEPRASDLVTALLSKHPDYPAAELIELAGAQSASINARDPQQALTRLLSQTTPAARGVLGHRAGEYLSHFWRALIPLFSGARFDPAQPCHHATWLHEQLYDWPAVLDALAEEGGNVNGHPVLLARRAQAQFHVRNRGGAIRDWITMCWCWPDHAATLLNGGALADHTLALRWRTFRDLDTDAGEDPRWFPAWLLCVEPALRHVTANIELDGNLLPQRAFAVLQTLVCDERGSSTVATETRANLRDYAPWVLAWYLEQKE